MITQEAAAALTVNSGDTAWVLTSSALVMVMTVGLAFFYGGLVRSKNALNTMMMSVVALGVISVTWVLFGYSLAFGPGGNSIIGGTEWLGFNGVGVEPNASYGATIPLQAHAVFQLMFAIITPALISGAIVERMKFKAYVAFLALWGLVVYVPLAHWVWAPDGWLFKMGALDFAGGTVVHISAGVSAFVAAKLLGPRQGFKRTPLLPHNVPLVLLGAGMLWFGWFGFNAGSALAANGLAALAFVNTNTAAAAALVTWALLDTVRGGKVTAVGAATGAVVGLVCITPAAGYVTARAAIVIGMAGAFVSYFAIQVRSRSKLDDSLDVFSCHGLAGIAGALLTGVFATKLANPAAADGLLAGNAKQLVTQFIAVGAAIGLAVVGTVVIFYAVRAVFGVRPEIRDEMLGLDLADHGEEAYLGGDLGGFGPGVGIGQGVVLSTSPQATPKVRPAPAKG
jgi:ammonium transporter, Amt family